jgi:5-methylcytosine-specific restriction protein A
MPAPDYRSAEAKEYRGWYKLARWKRLRAWRLLHEPLCRLCAAISKVTAATVVDHVKPHKGDAGLFWDPNNTQSLCADCHDRHKQSQERTGHLVGADADGTPVDANHHWHAADA